MDVAAAADRELEHRCRSCGAPIRWAQTHRHQWVALDPEPDRHANFVLLRDGVRVFELPIELVAGETDTERRTSANAEFRYRAHRTTCGVGPGVRRVGDSALRWLRGDDRGDRRRQQFPTPATFDPPVRRPTWHCLGCDALCIWGHSPADGWMPLDAEPHRAGLLRFLTTQPTDYRVEPVGFGGDRRSRYANHHLRCGSRFGKRPVLPDPPPRPIV
jgi:hypothetical protein